MVGILIIHFMLAFPVINSFLTPLKSGHFQVNEPLTSGLKSL